MRKRGRHSQPETNQQLIRPSQEQEKIDAALLLMATRIGRVITERMVEMWHRDLAVYPVDGIEWAFDSWGRNAKRLPVLSDITELLTTWAGGKVPEYGCESECHALHGKGYHTNDILWLMKKRMSKHTPGEKWSLADWEAAFNELDEKRAGGAPEWRKTTEGQQFLRAV